MITCQAEDPKVLVYVSRTIEVHGSSRVCAGLIVVKEAQARASHELHHGPKSLPSLAMAHTSDGVSRRVVVCTVLVEREVKALQPGDFTLDSACVDFVVSSAANEPSGVSLRGQDVPMWMLGCGVQERTGGT